MRFIVRIVGLTVDGAFFCLFFDILEMHFFIVSVIVMCLRTFVFLMG